MELRCGYGIEHEGLELSETRKRSRTQYIAISEVRWNHLRLILHGSIEKYRIAEVVENLLSSMRPPPHRSLSENWGKRGQWDEKGCGGYRRWDTRTCHWIVDNWAMVRHWWPFQNTQRSCDFFSRLPRKWGTWVNVWWTMPEERKASFIWRTLFAMSRKNGQHLGVPNLII